MDQVRATRMELLARRNQADLAQQGARLLESKREALLRELLEMAGGVRKGRTLKGVIPGGMSMPVLPAGQLDVPMANEFLSWRGECESTIRNSYQILSRGEPNLENELWSVSAQVINGDITPDEAAQQIQDGLEKWYEPQQ